MIEGYALKFNAQSNVLGRLFPFRETIRSSALDEADMSDVVAAYNHDYTMVLGRSTVRDGPGSLQLTVDGIGLRFRCAPTDTTYARDLVENIRAGVVTKCSFAFSLSDDEDADTLEYNDQDGVWERTVNKIGKLYDVSVVTFPAYSDTEAVVSSRSLNKVQDHILRKKLLLKTYF